MDSVLDHLHKLSFDLRYSRTVTGGARPYSRTGSSGNGGSLLVGPNGSFQVADGYKVLVFIEDFGGDARVALLP
jgi:hypothetical protein